MKKIARYEQGSSPVLHGRWSWIGLVLYGLALAGCGVLQGCGGQDGQAVAQAEETQGSPTAATEPAHSNRLAGESSPYLLLHAHNPVDWYPWGPEAFEKARKENKPIFLSIGYSSCYWCHVMERQSFSNDEIAKFMNEHFVNIKVDREERPDLDDIYMTSCVLYFQLIGSPQGGGWPLSLFLTPEAKPFAAGTYFPPEDSDGRLGFLSVLKRVNDLWTNQHDALKQNAEILTAQVQKALASEPPEEPAELTRDAVKTVVDALKSSYDSEFGGLDFSGLNPNEPKFPVPGKLALLQHEALRRGDEEAGRMVNHTLDQIAAGGIHDHLAGGFHRYSTDRRWHVPHFEKMLYDQAQLADVYIEAYRQTQKRLYREVAEGIFDFVLAEMTLPDASANVPGGGFYSAIDAETDAVEGKYYVWTRDEVNEILGQADARLFARVYGLDTESGLEHGHVLHRTRPLSAVAAAENTPLLDLENRLAAMRAQLLDVRKRREPPLKDDKILSGWNGLMIRAFAHAGHVLGREDYIEQARRCALFVLARMRDADGQLLHSFRSDRAHVPAFVDDYALMVEGLLTLHQATRERKWLNAARGLTEMQIAGYWDESEGGFFFTAHDHETLIARSKPVYDSVVPSGNSVSVRNLIRLASLTDHPEYRDRAETILQNAAHSIEQAPQGMAGMALAASEFLDNPDFSVTADVPHGTSELDETGQTPIQLVNAEADAGSASPTESQPGAAPKKQDDKVVGRAYLSVDRLPAGKSCRLLVLLRIAEGWHINSNPAQPDYLPPTELTVTSVVGCTVSNTQYPAGKTLEVEGFDEPFRIYENQVAIYTNVSVPAQAGGKTELLTLEVSYQACSDARCLKPSKLRFQGRIPVAGVGQPVKAINESLFP